MIDFGRVFLILVDVLLWMLAAGFAGCVVLMAIFAYYSVRDYLHSKVKQDLDVVATAFVLMAVSGGATGLLVFFATRLVS